MSVNILFDVQNISFILNCKFGVLSVSMSLFFVMPSTHDHNKL